MTQSELYTYARRLVNANSSDWPESDLVVDLNDAQSDIWVRIKSARGILEYDDKLYADLPTSTFAVTAGTAAYKITADENSNEIITIHKVQIQDAGGKYHDIPRKRPVEEDQNVLLDISSNTEDIPSYYYENGYSVVFSSIPSRSTTAKIWYDRAPKYLVSGGTTTVPGIPVIYHSLIGEKASLKYAVSKGMNVAKNILSLVEMGDNRITVYEKSRRNDEQVRMAVAFSDNR